MDKIKIKTKDFESPWITKRIKNLLKRSNVYKKRSEKTKKEYEDYKKLFESIKKRSKKLYFSELILKYKNINLFSQKDPKILVDKKSITEAESVAEKFNKYVTQIGPTLTKNIGTSNKSFNEYIKKHGTTQPEKAISVNEFKDAFFFFKNK